MCRDASVDEEMNERSLRSRPRARYTEQGIAMVMAMAMVMTDGYGVSDGDGSRELY